MVTKNLPQIYTVILTCNGQKIIRHCLSSVKKLQITGFHLKIIIVDNGSKDGTVETVSREFTEVIIIDNRVNYGFARGINYGLRLALQQGADYLLLLNDDTILPKDFLSKLVSRAKTQSYPICGPKILTTDQKIWSLGGRIDKLRFSGSLIGYGQNDSYSKKDEAVDFISGTAMLVARKVFEKTGFMDEDYFLYYDDVDFCYQAKKAGFKSFLIPNSEIIHLESITIKKHSPAHYYYARKSHLLFIFKRAPFLIKLRELLRMPKTIFELLIQKDKTKRKYELWAIADFFLGNFGQNSSINPF